MANEALLRKEMEELDKTRERLGEELERLKAEYQAAAAARSDTVAACWEQLNACIAEVAACEATRADLQRRLTGLTPEQCLEQQLAPLNFFKTTPPTTGEYPPPAWELKVWQLDLTSVTADVQAALASYSRSGEEPLRALRYTNLDDQMQSEAGVKASMLSPLADVSSVLRSVGHAGCKWVLEATAAAAAGSARARGAVKEPASKSRTSTLKVQGILGKKPDYELFDGSGRIHSFIEFKVPPLLDAAGGVSLASLDLEARRMRGRPAADAQPIVPGPVLSNVFGRVEQYCRARKVRFFAISTYSYTWLCHARDQCIFVSKGLASDCTKPTLMQALFWLSLNALGADGSLSDAEVATPQPPAGYGCGDEPNCSSCADNGSEEDAEEASSSSSSSSSQTHASRAPGESSAEKRVSVQYIPGVETVLGTGRTGPVYAGSLDGVPVAVKWTEAGSAVQQALEHEASMLRLVQGPLAPRVVFAGLSACGRWFLLLTSRVFGRPLEQGDVHLLAAALAALRSVHAMGLCHGDVKPDNFMQEERGTQLKEVERGQRVIVLDLGRSKLCSSDEEGRWKQLEEEKQLCALLGGEVPRDEGTPEDSACISQVSARASHRGTVIMESVAGRRVASRATMVMGQLENRQRLQPAGARLVPCPAVQLGPRLHRAVGLKPTALIRLI